MVANVGSLNVRVGADISDLIAGMGRAQDTVKRSADSISKSAKASAKVFQDAKRQADSLLSSVDPLYAAQLRYDKELAKAQELMRSGALTAGEMVKVQAGLKAQLDGAAKSFGGMTGASGRSRAGLQQLSFQLGDVSQGIAMGTKASTIFAQQSGQVIQSLQLMGGEGNKFLKFLGGPWGMVISAAAVLLTPLIAKLFETKDEVGALVDKMREQAKQAALNERADALWKNTIEGLTAAIKKRREEQEKSLQTDIQSEQQSLREIQREANQAKERLAQEQARLRNLEAARAATVREIASPSSADIRQQEQQRNLLVEIDKKIAESRKNIAQLNTDVARAEQSVRGAQIPILERGVAAKLDNVQAATDEYTRTLGTLRDELTAGSITQKQFEDRLESAAKKLKAVKDAAKDAGDGLAKFTLNEAVQIVHDQFGANPSSHQLTGGKHAKNSYHYAGQAVDFVPAGGMGSVTKEQVRAAFEAAGAKILELLGPGDKGHSDHFHVAFSKQRQGPDQIAAAQERREHKLEQEADRALQQQNAFEEARDRLNGQLLQAQGVLVRGVEAQADFATKRVTEEEERQANAIRHDLAEGKYGDATSKVAQARAEQLLVLNHSLAEEKRADIQISKREVLEEKAFRLADQRMSLAIDDLKYQDDIAKTAAEHREAQLAILDAVYKQKKYELEHEKQLAIRNGATADEIAAIQDKIDALPTNRSREADQIRRGTMGPLEQWAASIPQTAAQVNEALQSIEAQGLDGLADAISSVIDGTKNLKEAFGDLAKSIISDIIRMTLRMLIFRAISGLLGGGMPSNPFGANEVNLGPDINLTPSASTVDLGFATGGSFTVLGRKGIDKNVMSINGVPIANVSHGERVHVDNDNAPGGVGGRLIVELNDPMLRARISEGARIEIVHTAPIMQASFKQSIRDDRRRR